jgi:hypothetical protein
MSSRPEVFEFHTSGGGLAPDDPSYVSRPEAEGLFLDALRRGEYCYVLNARQTGKTSLRNRAEAWLKPEIDCVVIDLQYGFNRTMSEDRFCQSVVKQVVQQTCLRERISPQNWWAEQGTLTPFQRLDELFELLLGSSPRQTVIFVDEIDKLLDFEFRDDFLLRVRSYYERRQIDSAFRRLGFVLIGVATPSELVRDQKKSPFNIGIGIPLEPLRLEESRRSLRFGLESFADPDAVLEAVFGWTGGQPFLTQKVCELAAEQQKHPEPDGYAEWLSDLVSRYLTHNRTFLSESHIRSIHSRMLPATAGDLADEARSANLLTLYGRVLEGERVESDGSSEQIELRLTGLVIERDGRLEVANQIYQIIFDRAWVAQKLEGLRPYSASFSQWLRGDRSEDYLLRGAALAEGRNWSRGKNLTEGDRDYLRQSETAEALRTERLAAGVKYRRLAWILLVVALLAIGFAIFAWVQRGNAQRSQEKEREAAQVAQQAAQVARDAVGEARVNAREAQRQKEAADDNARKAETNAQLARTAQAEAVREQGIAQQQARAAERSAQRAESLNKRLLSSNDQLAVTNKKLEQSSAAEKKAAVDATEARRVADEKTAEATQALENLRRESRMNQARGLARAAIIQAESDPPLALNLALYAWRLEAPRISTETVEAVYRAVLDSLMLGKGRAYNQFAAVAFEQNGGIAGVELVSGVPAINSAILLRPPSPGEPSPSVPAGPRLLDRETAKLWCSKAGVSAISISVHASAGLGCSDGSVVVRTGTDLDRLAALFRPHRRRIQAIGIDGINTLSVDVDGNVAFSVAEQVQWRTKLDSPASDKALVSVGGRWAAAAGADGIWVVWDAQTGRPRTLAYGPDMAFDSTGNCLFSQESPQYLERAGVKSNSNFPSVPFFRAPRVAAGPKCKYLAWSDAGGTIYTTGEGIGDSPLALSRTPAPIDSIAFSEDGAKLATAAGTEVIVWDFQGALAAAPLLAEFARVIGSERPNTELPISDLEKFEALLPLARQRVRRNLTTDECQQYLGSTGCPKNGF